MRPSWIGNTTNLASTASTSAANRMPARRSSLKPARSVTYQPASASTATPTQVLKTIERTTALANALA